MARDNGGRGDRLMNDTLSSRVSSVKPFRLHNSRFVESSVSPSRPIPLTIQVLLNLINLWTFD
jgi:hypothetical protein